MARIPVQTGSRRGVFVVEGAWLALLAGGAAAVLVTTHTSGVVALAPPAPTTLQDFFGPGTQPGMLTDGIESVNRCDSCHGGYDALHEPLRPWAASLMGQAMRDPMFRACLTIANQDAAFAGDLCLRCHTPGGWVEGRSTPTDGSALLEIDYEGVNCNFCHRMVDPHYVSGVSPAVDQAILAALPDGVNEVPLSQHSGHFVLDPEDRRRGPFDLGNFNKHDWYESAFHASSTMCATCHDVSNPAFSRQPDDTYALNDLDTPAPSHNKLDQFPIERTYSEWLMSDFALGPVQMGGRYGGNLTAVSSCQDCHMPDETGKGCKTGEERTNLPTHYFNGGNTWVLDAVRNLYPDADTGLSAESVAASNGRAEQMLRNAADLDAWQAANELVVRVTNWSGHKLPTGYPEGRRMWLTVEFYDELGNEIVTHGHYDDATATLTTTDTRVWEAKLGIEAGLAAAIGLPAGEGFHFAVNNVWIKDNRIPPLGFTYAGFDAVQAAPVGAVYPDGQHWDEVRYEVPAQAASAEVELYFQLASREYIEFLRDENTTDSAGDELWAQYVATGMGAPVEMAAVQLAVDGAQCPADMNGDGVVDNGDIGSFVTLFLAGDPAADFTGDGLLDNGDIGAFVQAFLAGCPGS